MQLCKRDIEQWYHLKKLNTKEIAMKLGVTQKKVWYFMVKNGIPRRSKKDVVVSDLTNRVFGKLKVVRRATECEKNKGALWLCKCKCGGEKVIRGSSLLNGFTKSCGCKWRTASYQRISGIYWWGVREGAKRRNLKFTITKEDMWQLYLSQGKRCALSNVNIDFGEGLTRKNQTASLDRIDPSRGYEEKNVRWVHKLVNQMKMAMTDQEFCEWIKKISRHMRTE